MSRDAQNALVANYCASCHGAGSRKNDLVLENLDVGSPFLGAETLEKIILKVRAGMMPPASAAQPDPTALRSFVEALESRADAAAARADDPGFRPMVRLNRAEYSRAVKDLLDVDIDAAAYLPADTVSAGFDNIADVQVVSPALITAYLRIAAEVSRRSVLTCAKPERDSESACAKTIIGRLITTAFRGRETAEDEADAMAMFAKGRENGTFEDGIRRAVQSILVHPKFLFRAEPARSGATANAVDGTSIASRLSFFLWSTGPDAALQDAARRGDLANASGREAQVRRMLADPKAAALATRFAALWLRLPELEHSEPDPKLFSSFDRDLARSMRRETELLFEDVVRRDRNVLDLLTSDEAYVDERLARHYGIEGVRGPTFRKVRLPASRRGLLGNGSILTLTSLGNRTSPVLRGKWVLDVLLGTPPPPPPPNVPALEDSVQATLDGVTLSTRQRLEEHRRNPACSSCHNTIDPPGLALERFDATGATRTADNGAALDLASDLYDGRPMEGEAGLRDALLAHRDQVLRNFAHRLLTYATNRRLGPRDMAEVRAIVRAAEAKEQRFSAFVLGVVESRAFLRAKEPKES